jgi:acyl-CoA reductase-like NAD-dependent aldehyde dehydrogenase
MVDAAGAKRFNHGQTCCAGSRVFVHESVYDKFIQKFTETLKAIKVGDPFQPDTYQGPQVSQVQYAVRAFLSLPSFALFVALSHALTESRYR